MNNLGLQKKWEKAKNKRENFLWKLALFDEKDLYINYYNLVSYYSV